MYVVLYKLLKWKLYLVIYGKFMPDKVPIEREILGKLFQKASLKAEKIVRERLLT